MLIKQIYYIFLFQHKQITRKSNNLKSFIFQWKQIRKIVSKFLTTWKTCSECTLRNVWNRPWVKISFVNSAALQRFGGCTIVLQSAFLVILVSNEEFCDKNITVSKDACWHVRIIQEASFLDSIPPTNPRIIIAECLI